MRPADLDRCVGILNEGGIIILPVDTVYGLAAKGFHPAAFERLDKIKGERRTPYVLAFASVDRLCRLFTDLDLFQRRIIRYLLPGPVTLILPAGESIPAGFRYREQGIGVRVSTDPVLRAVSRALDGPLWATSVNRSTEPAPTQFADIQPGVLKQVDMAFDGGPTIFRQPSTVVDGRRFPYRILRSGPWVNRVEQTLSRCREPVEVLVVCTGNICRSPLAAAMLQGSLGPPEDSLVRVSSAGTSALTGNPATPEIVDIARDWGVDLSNHTARQLTPGMIENADLILAVGPAHAEFILENDANSCSWVRMLGEPIGMDVIPDPYRLDPESYRRVTEMIRRAVEWWSGEIRRLVPREVPGEPARGSADRRAD